MNTPYKTVAHAYISKTYCIYAIATVLLVYIQGYLSICMSCKRQGRSEYLLMGALYEMNRRMIEPQKRLVYP